MTSDRDSTTAFSLLTERLFTTRSRKGDTELSLPQVLANLSQGHNLEFAALRSHQHHAWHAFLVQLGALVAQKLDRSELDLTAEEWTDALIELAGSHAAWCLFVEDLAAPAFMQPPVPEASLTPLEDIVETPDAVDVLWTTRNHDEKQERMAHSRPEHWTYALITLQTMEGYFGRRKYGIARMNGAYGSRPGVGFAADLSWTARFRRDVAVWLEFRGRLVEEYGYRRKDGQALLWTVPWNGDDSLSLQTCDPFFVEICRRVRLTWSESYLLQAHAGTTSCTRLAAKKAKGNTGDIWTPVASEGKALTVTRGGFHYRLLSRLLMSGDFPQRPALVPRDTDGAEPILVAQVLVRGQGRTDGYHQRLLPVPENVKRKLGPVEDRAELGRLAKGRVDQARVAQRDVLRPALWTLLQGGKRKLDIRDDRPRVWIERLDEKIDEIFFEDLWRDLEVPEETRRRRWDRRLLELAREELREATNSAPIPLSQMPRAIAKAELMFGGLARKHLTGAFATEEPNDINAEEPA